MKNEIKNKVIKVLEHNGYFLSCGKSYMKILKFGSIEVEIKDVSSSVFEVAMSCVLPGMHGSGMVTVQVRELFDKEVYDEYSMYDEHTPEEIMLHMMDDFYARAYFMNALSSGKKLCIYEEPDVPRALSASVPF